MHRTRFSAPPASALLSWVPLAEPGKLLSNQDSSSAFASIHKALFAQGLGLHGFVVVVVVMETLLVVVDVAVMLEVTVVSVVVVSEVVEVVAVALVLVRVRVVVEEQTPHMTGQFFRAKVPTSIVSKQWSFLTRLPHAGCSDCPKQLPGVYRASVEVVGAAVEVVVVDVEVVSSGCSSATRSGGGSRPATQGTNPSRHTPGDVSAKLAQIMCTLL